MSVEVGAVAFDPIERRPDRFGDAYPRSLRGVPGPAGTPSQPHGAGESINDDVSFGLLPGGAFMVPHRSGFIGIRIELRKAPPVLTDRPGVQQLTHVALDEMRTLNGGAGAAAARPTHPQNPRG